MQIVPLKATANQTTLVQLNGQSVQLNVYQKSTGLFMDVLVSNLVIITGVLCRNKRFIIYNGYLGFSGDLMFIDNQGDDDPDYTGLGDRWSLVYILPSELPVNGVYG